MMDDDCFTAHRFSMNHRRQLENDAACGCFHCLRIFEPKEILEWINDVSGTAVCPYCGVDSVIGAYSGHPVTPEFLEQMRQYWF